MAAGSAAALIRHAIALVNAAADGADDEELTPSEIAEVIRDAREARDLASPGHAARVQRFLGEALDAVADGMSADYTAMILYAALGALQEGEQRGSGGVAGDPGQGPTLD